MQMAAEGILSTNFRMAVNLLHLIVIGFIKIFLIKPRASLFKNLLLVGNVCMYLVHACIDEQSLALDETLTHFTEAVPLFLDLKITCTICKISRIIRSHECLFVYFIVFHVQHVGIISAPVLSLLIGRTY